MAAHGQLSYEPKADTKRIVFLFAAGVGITPLFSILKTALTAEKDSKIVLVYSNSSKERTLFYDELLEWQSRYQDRLHIEFIWSDSKYLQKARLNQSEEHTSELQSRENLVCRLLLEKKK